MTRPVLRDLTPSQRILIATSYQGWCEVITSIDAVVKRGSVRRFDRLPDGRYRLTAVVFVDVPASAVRELPR